MVHANVGVILACLGSRQENQHRFETRGLVGAPNEFLADSPLLIGMVNREVGKINAKAVIGDRP